MRVTQITHHDLDGYGAMTVAAALCDVARVVHVARYSDVGPVVEDELRRLAKTAEPETLLMTDLSLEAVAVKFVRSFAAMNRRRAEAGQAGHRLVVLDHHASSVGQLAEQGVASTPEGEALRFDLGDPEVTVLVDESMCATRLTLEHRALYATREDPGLAPLVAYVDALDLWRKDRPTFPGGQTLDEVFWDNVGPIVPLGHPWHDRFVAELLRAVTARLEAGASPAEVEAEVGALRKGIVDAWLADDPEDDPRQTARMRVARVLARSDTLFRPLTDGTLLSFGLDAGTFQRVSDLIMERGAARRVVNVQRMGSLSFRSVDGTALDGARRFRGGGHRDAAGGKLPNGSAYSLADAIAQVEPVLNPPPPDPSASPFGALKNWKG